jgi:hypothetical protein
MLKRRSSVVPSLRRMWMSHVGRTALGIIVVAAVAACTARPTATVAGSPIDTVRDAVALLEAERWAEIGDLACAARRDEVRARFDVRPDIAAALPPELTVDQALGAISVDVETLELEETLRLGDQATVHLDAIVRITTDRLALRSLVREVAQERGTPISDPVAAGIADAFAGALRSRSDLDVMLQLRVEGGAWRFCW